MTSSGAPTPRLTLSGDLPDGVTFNNHGDGTASLTGLPSADTAGSYPLIFTASYGIQPDAVQGFTVVVSPQPGIPPAVSSALVFLPLVLQQQP